RLRRRRPGQRPGHPPQRRDGVRPVTALPLGLIPAHHAAADPDRLALRCETTSLTRREFADAVERAARHLQASGVRAGDTVAIALPNGIAFLVTTFAAWRLDAVP